MLGKLFAKIWPPAQKTPALPYRCGTMLLRADPAMHRAIVECWKQSEAEYRDWVARHPSPDPEWIETAKRLANRSD